MEAPQPKPLFGALTMYRGRGAFLHRLEQFEKAIRSYDQAFVNEPEDVRLLVDRGRVRVDAVKPAQALQDVELALALRPNHVEAKFVRASALYTMGEYERSVVICHRGARLRHQPHYFQDGISQGEATIQNCIGENAGHVMSEFLPLIKKMEARHIDDNEPQRMLRKSRIPRPEQRKKLTQTQQLKHLTLSRVLAMKYLGPMAYDKFFLQALVTDRRLIGANSKGSRELRELAVEALQMLNERQELLRSQRPYYSVKLAEKTESSYQTNYNKQLLENERRINTRTAERLIRQIEMCMRSLRVNDLVAKAERMKVFLNNKTLRTLPDKDSFIERLYRAVGEGYLSQHRLSYKKSERSNRRRVAFLMGLPVARPTSYDSVLAMYPYKFTDAKHALENLYKDLEICENSYMKCWLLYEIAHLLNIQKNYTLAKFYAKRCQREAQEIDSVTWWLNACFMLMSGDVQQGNTNEVRVLIEEALEWSKQMGYAGTIREFLTKCAEMVSEPIGADEEKAVTVRENQILQVTDESVRGETQVLFKRISTLPTLRRFSVLPQRRKHGDMTSSRYKRKQRGLTVVPGVERSLPAPPRSRVPGFQSFEF